MTGTICQLASSINQRLEGNCIGRCAAPATTRVIHIYAILSACARPVCHASCCSCSACYPALKSPSVIRQHLQCHPGSCLPIRIHKGSHLHRYAACQEGGGERERERERERGRQCVCVCVFNTNPPASWNDKGSARAAKQTKAADAVAKQLMARIERLEAIADAQLRLGCLQVDVQTTTT